MSAVVRVLKFGGSVLSAETDYHEAAKYVAKEQQKSGSQLVIVVSAQYGHTDVLEQQAAAIDPQLSSPALDILWSTGELRSVALFSLHLSRLGCNSRPLHIHQTGVTIEQERVEIDPSFLLDHLQHDTPIILPGFFGLRADSNVVSLGRGASDLSAVLYADALHCFECELIKDVPGYFTVDPKLDPSAAHIAAIDYDSAIARSMRGEQIVQEKALLEAKRRGIAIRISDLSQGGLHTLVSARGKSIEEIANSGPAKILSRSASRVI